MPPNTRPKRARAPSPEPMSAMSRKPAKRSRAAIENEDEDGEARLSESMVPKRRKSKRGGKTVTFDADRRELHSDPVEGSSSSSVHTSTPNSPEASSASTPLPRPLKPSTTVTEADVAEFAALYDETINNATPAGLLLRHAKARVDAANEQVAKLLDSQRQSELKIKQDMLLSLVKKEEAVRKYADATHRWKKESERVAKELETATKEKEEVKKRHEEDILLQKSKVIRAECETRMWRDEAEHAALMQRTLEEDLDELRRIENEEQVHARQKRQKNELPPAYGSLDDDTNFPPSYEAHAEDSGALDVATFKRTVRSTFMRALTTAQAEMEHVSSRRHINPEIDPYAAQAAMAVSFCASLADAARNLDGILKHTKDVSNIHVCRFVEAQDSPMDISHQTEAEQAEKAREYKNVVQQQSARCEYVADRAAKLLIDLTFRLIAAMEVRPYSPRFTPANKQSIALSWTAVDSTLSESLRRSFSFPTATSNSASTSPDGSKLLELQFFLTQVSILTSRLCQLRLTSHSTPHGGGRTVLERSWSWLVDQVEKERELLASARDRLADERDGAEARQLFEQGRMEAFREREAFLAQARSRHRAGQGRARNVHESRAVGETVERRDSRTERVRVGDVVVMDGMRGTIVEVQENGAVGPGRRELVGGGREGSAVSSLPPPAASDSGSDVE